jgi:hypothetical protein
LVDQEELGNGAKEISRRFSFEDRQKPDGSIARMPPRR